MLLLLAHFDGKALYFGKEKAPFEEIAALENRKYGGHPRTAVLFACNTGGVIQRAALVLQEASEVDWRTICKEEVFLTR